MLFFSLLLSSSYSWSDQMLAVAGEIGFGEFSEVQKKRLLSVFENAGDDFERISQATAWLYYVDRPPFNLHSFTHWHFVSTPITDKERPIEKHIDIDNLMSNLDAVNRKIIAGSIGRTWPFSFTIKTYLALQCDVFSPLHVSELYNDEFPNGDRNGRDFYVVFNGKKVSLFDVWESGCGEFSTTMDFENEEDWKNVDKIKSTLEHEFREWEHISDPAVEEETFNFTRDFVYNGIHNNSVLSEEYVKKCREYSREQVFRAGKTLAYQLEDLDIVKISKQMPTVSSFRTSEVVAWSVMLIFAPFAVLLVWKKHFAPK